MKEKNEAFYNLQTMLNSYWQRISGYISNSWQEKTRVLAPGVTEVDPGIKKLLTGKVYKINPNPSRESKPHDFAYDIGPILDELDQQHEGRKAYSKFNTLTDGTHLLADTSPDAIKIRSLLIYYLKDLEHIDKITQQVLTETREKTDTTKMSPEQFIRTIILKILMKLFFASDQLPEDTIEIMKLFASTAFSLSFSTCSQLSFFDSKHRKAKQQYKKFAKELMSTQVHLIFDRFQSDCFDPELKGENLFVDLIIQQVKENYPSLAKDKKALKRYLKNLDEQEIIHYLDDMTSFPSILILADNVSAVVVEFIKKLYLTTASAKSQPSMLGAIQQEGEMKFPDKVREGSNLTRKELRELQNLDTYYHQALKALATSNVIGRYNKNPVRLKNKKTGDEVEIPANSFLFFELGSAAAEEKDVAFSSNFSVPGHTRKCPGSQVAAQIFKAIVNELIFGPKRLAFDSINSCYLIDRESQSKLSIQS
ncbi:hypothetical protein Lnau_2545 [Legionella nautarum]|uniref:Cytochrome P450 n=1 Tax=Legionella nautarum TaxID=45070 RepID=A0A0W0WKR6_9GAMM|nr:hypothetical protein [Legionella nautarum]KTD32897.1 hypothetical protein Lnau_2545 [Legionella nautarum]